MARTISQQPMASKYLTAEDLSRLTKEAEDRGDTFVEIDVVKLLDHLLDDLETCKERCLIMREAVANARISVPLPHRN